MDLPEVDRQRSRFNALRRRKTTLIVVLVAALAVVLVWAFSSGASSVSLRTLFNLSEATEQQFFILTQVRLPRVFAGLLIGAALAVAGLFMQIVFQNPLVSPYTLGISNGAAFGASLAIVFASGAGYYTIPFFAFIFSVLTMVLVFGISQVARGRTSVLLLTGVAVGYLFSALVSGLKYVADTRDLPELVFWQMGSLAGIRWIPILVLTVCVIVAVVVGMSMAWQLNVAALGPEEALALGVNYRAVQVVALVLSTMLTAVAVSFGGVIGFIGLVAPHVATMMVGTDARYSLPTTVLVGAILLLASDTVARTIVAPTELPVGIITSLIGVPFFLFLILRRRRVG